jgi:hypothetical protein
MELLDGRGGPPSADDRLWGCGCGCGCGCDGSEAVFSPGGPELEGSTGVALVSASGLGAFEVAAGIGTVVLVPLTSKEMANPPRYWCTILSRGGRVAAAGSEFGPEEEGSLDEGAVPSVDAPVRGSEAAVETWGGGRCT